MASNRVIRNRALAGLTAIVAAVGIVSLLPSTAPATPAQPVTESVTEQVQCQEDMPCWDCKTMGNKVCGPAADEVVPDSAATTYYEAYYWCADMYFADLTARADCQRAALRAFTDPTNPTIKQA